MAIDRCIQQTETIASRRLLLVQAMKNSNVVIARLEGDGIRAVRACMNTHMASISVAQHACFFWRYSQTIAWCTR